MINRQNLAVFLSQCLLLSCFQLDAMAVSANQIGDYEVTERIKIGGVGGWDFINFDQAHQRLFITRGDRVQVWDTKSKQVLQEIKDTQGVHGVALAQALNTGFTSNGRANTVTVFNLNDLSVIENIAVPGNNPDAILYEPKFKRVYTFNGRSKDATVIDAESHKVVTNIPLGGKPEVAVDDSAGRIFVNIEDTAEIVSIDQSSNKVISRWKLTGCNEPTGLAIDTEHHRLFSACDNQKLVVIDSTSGSLVATVPIGSAPDGVEFDPVKSNVFTSNGEGTLTIIHEVDADHFIVKANLLTQAKARTLSLDTENHRIYLVTANFGPTPPATKEEPKPRASVLPDSFTIITVSPKL